MQDNLSKGPTKSDSLLALTVIATAVLLGWYISPAFEALLYECVL